MRVARATLRRRPVRALPSRRLRGAVGLLVFGPWIGLVIAMVTWWAPADVLERWPSMRAFTDVIAGMFPSIAANAALHPWPQVALLGYAAVLVAVPLTMVIVVPVCGWLLRAAAAEGSGGIRPMTREQHLSLVGMFLLFGVGGLWAHVFIPVTFGMYSGSMQNSRGWLGSFHALITWLGGGSFVFLYVSLLSFLKFGVEESAPR